MAQGLRYLGSLVTALRTPAVSGGVNTETRIARLVELTVPGTADLQVSLSELEHRPASGGEEFTVTVRNTGNVLCTLAGTLNITGGGSARTVPLTPTGIYVIPGGSATITGRLADLPALGRRAVTASMTASVPGGAAKTVDSNTVRLSYFPWLTAALTVGGLVALGLLLVITRKRRRAWLRRRTEERTALRALRRELRAGNPPAGDPHACAGSGRTPGSGGTD
ncbi:hypothetical protein [Streptomyces erythrochromogenes]|uniref:hypothetical protein n=1 Tax=Streptomyces erythrochromogenes TaxID=285574 RepID=UPI0036B5A42C